MVFTSKPTTGVVAAVVVVVVVVVLLLLYIFLADGMQYQPNHQGVGESSWL